MGAAGARFSFMRQYTPISGHVPQLGDMIKMAAKLMCLDGEFLPDSRTRSCFSSLLVASDNVSMASPEHQGLGQFPNHMGREGFV